MSLVRGIYVATAAAALATGWAAAPPTGDTATVTVVFTSDVHGNVLPIDQVRQRPLNGSLAQVASLVRRIRADNPNTIMIDGGDAIQGTPLAYYEIATPGIWGVDPTVAAMNLIGYDVAVLGNHEFNFGLEVLRRSLQQSRFPWLAANLAGASRANLPVQQSIVLECGGVRVAVLGLTNPNVPQWDPPDHWTGLLFTDPVEAARRLVPRLRNDADVVVVVAHSGFERDLESGAADGSHGENFAWRLAQVPGIDLLLTGHTHRDIPPRRLGSTIVAQPGRWAELVTRVDFVMTRLDGGWRLANWRGENLAVGVEAPASDVVVAAEAARRRVDERLATPVGELAAPLDFGGVRAGDDPAVDLIHAVQLEVSGAQLSLAAPLAGRADRLPAGELTLRAIHDLYPYPNTLVVVELTAAQVVEVLEHALRGWLGVSCTGADCRALRDRRVPPFAFDTLEGATYVVDLSAPEGARVRGFRAGGRQTAPEERFSVAVNSYRAAGGGGVPHLAAAPRLREIRRPMVELVADYLHRRRPLIPVATHNWFFTLEFSSALASP